MYPERLLIYNAGTGKTVVLGSIKISLIFFFGVSCLLLAPVVYSAPEGGVWWAAAVVVGGAMPLLIVAPATAPFVSQIFLRLPPYARRSREQLARYSSGLPPDALLELTALRVLPWSRTVTSKLSELKPRRKSGFWDIANLERTPEKVARRDGKEVKVPWWVGKPLRRFYVGGEEGMTRSRAPGIWKSVMEGIKKNAQRA
ncbi:hypothetical protein BJ546DRAFT_946278 [Cryomyces antarcticus]|nr:hypothetical protein LTR60_003815 [Cryomyces antarcticus]